MTPIRVMVVDDSVVVRRLVINVLEEDPDIEVVGHAVNGAMALDKLELLSPDVVTLDIEMPVMDGLETLKHIRSRKPRLPVIMFSTLTERGAIATLDALAAGANDFVTKPANVGGITEGMDAIRQELIPKLKLLVGRRVTPRPSTAGVAARPAPTRPAVAPPRPSPSVPARIVVIGVSTGGPNALAAIWESLPVLNVPVVIVQHMPPVFTAMLAKRLDNLGRTPVVEAAGGEVLAPGRAYLAPGDHHLLIESSAGGARLRLDDGPPEHSCRPAVDPLFRSAVTAYGPAVLGVVLTGMGSDGCDGAAVIRSSGGSVIAQDETTSVVWGMPGAVSRAGLSDADVALDRVAAEIVARVSNAPVRSSLATVGRRS